LKAEAARKVEEARKAEADRVKGWKCKDSAPVPPLLVVNPLLVANDDDEAMATSAIPSVSEQIAFVAELADNPAVDAKESTKEVVAAAPEAPLRRSKRTRNDGATDRRIS
jgi:hypothetical protein